MRSEFIRYLGVEVGGKIAKPPVKAIDKVSSTGSTRAGDVDLLWTLAQDLDISGIIDRMRYGKSSIPAGKVLTA